jgi:hypothetical protein
MNKNLSTHITALLSGATSILALVHPGFVIPPFVQGLAVTVPGIAAGLIEALHFVKTHNLQANLLAADHVVNQLVANATKTNDTPVA